ncbi:hypothetical protein [Rhodopila sp.]|uniref:hypothetical protein n=1 Tax=Rhodopila sp. TaxID=2480087 RepID=UPI003D0BB315
MSASTSEPPPASNLDLQPGDILLHLIVTLLAPMFMGVCCGNLDFARMAALETVNAHRARSHVDLIAVAQIVAHGLASVSSACLSMSDEISLSMTLRLRASANASDRACERNRRALEKNRATPVPDPVFPAEPEPADETIAEARRSADPPPSAAPTPGPHPAIRDPAPAAATAATPTVPTPPALAATSITPPQPAATPTLAPQPAASKAIASQSAASQSAASQSAASRSAASQSAASQPTASQPTASQPTASQPAATLHRVPPRPATPTTANQHPTGEPTAQEFQQLWSAAMTVVANEYAASTANLPPAERAAAQARAAVLNRAAGDLMSGDVPPRLRAGDLGTPNAI